MLLKLNFTWFYIILSLLGEQTKGKYTRDGENQRKVIPKDVYIGIKNKLRKGSLKELENLCLWERKLRSYNTEIVNRTLYIKHCSPLLFYLILKITMKTLISYIINNETEALREKKWLTEIILVTEGQKFKSIQVSYGYMERADNTNETGRLSVPGPCM